MGWKDALPAKRPGQVPADGGPSAPSDAATSAPGPIFGPVGNLVDLVQALSFCRDVASVMAVVRMAARALSGADGVTFVLRDGDLCHYADEDSIAPLWKGKRFPMSTCISGWVMLNRQPAIIPDIYQDPRIPHDAYRPTFVKSLVMVPVRAEEPVAAIGAYWAVEREPRAEEVALLQAVAHSTAVALTNVGLYESLRAAVAESQARADEAERANRAKSVFLAAISHDLRQPLQTMRLYHNMLNDRAATGRVASAGIGAVTNAGAHPATALGTALDRKLIAGLGEALSAGEELLRALLDVSVLDAGTVAVNRQRFGLEAVVAGLVSGLRGEAEKAGVDIRLRPGAKSGPLPALEEADTDPVLLKCILRNLLTNAIRYTGRGGRVLVATRRRGDAMLVQVWDTGIGIPADRMSTIFEDFVQLNNPERDRTKGLGLGLGIVRRMATLLDSAITVRSVPGRGSVFSVLVPCAPVAARVAAPAESGGGDKLLAFPRDGQHPAQRESDPRTILAVEDDALQRMALGAIIESWGYRVITASGSDEALAAIRDAVRLPGLVISDFRLPGPLNGVQLVARLGNEMRRHLPGIIVTGDTDPARIQEASATGCLLIHKPYLPETLRAAIDDALHGLEAPAAAGRADDALDG
ncbi:MAG: ATP-binding protein [Azospirillaceae bacterium]|nr:ATP-binding protein [Azospirillaceae bacterium]